MHDPLCRNTVDYYYSSAASHRDRKSKSAANQAAEADLSQQQHNCPNHHRKQKPSHAYSTPWGTTTKLPPHLPAPVLPPCATLPFPMWQGANGNAVDRIKLPFIGSTKKKASKNKHKSKNPSKKKSISFKAIVQFASSSVGKNISSHETGRGCKQQRRIVAIRRKPGRDGLPRRGRRIKWPPCPRPTLVPGAQITRKSIQPSSQVCLRHSFAVAATRGAIKRPIIHVEFDTPKSVKECMSCSSKDFLFVYVGLFHVFILQFIMVVLLFFANEKEVKLSEFTFL